MRITRNQLQGLINEEISRALLRSENSRLLEGRFDPGGSLYHAEAVDLLEFAQAYVSLGTAVQEQLEDLLDQQEDAEININAFDLIERSLRGKNEEIDTALDAWYKHYNGDDADTL